MTLSMNSVMHAAMNSVGAAALEATPVLEATLLPGVPPFQDWIALDDALPEPDAAAPIDGAAPNAAPAEVDTEQPDPALAAELAVAVDAMLSAMALPVAPAALPAMMMAMPAAKQDAANDGSPAPAPAVATEVEAGLPLIAPAVAPRAVPEAAVALPMPMPAAPPVPAARPAAAVAAAPAVDAGTADGADAPATSVSVGAAAPAAQPAATRSADTVTLAGPPTAWRQSLQEALGDRLQLQLGRNAEQATIRLDPPMLGRIEISVRHSGGNLEVHIAASNTEVLRQLNTVSDSLRSDLAGRQYATVSVNVSETPRAQASSQANHQQSGQPGADSQGRGRQQEQEQQARRPGLALDEAGDAAAHFSMN